MSKSAGSRSRQQQSSSSDSALSKRALADVTLLEIGALEEQLQSNASVQTFEKALRRVPSCAMFWLRYMEFLSDFPEKSVRVAERALLVCPHPDVYKKYLQIIKEVGTVQELLAAYGKAVHGIGQYWKSGEIWAEYTVLLKLVHNHQLRKEVAAAAAASGAVAREYAGMTGIQTEGGVLPAGATLSGSSLGGFGVGVAGVVVVVIVVVVVVVGVEI